MIASFLFFREHRVRKRYRAIVAGRMEGEGWMTEPISGLASKTRYKVVETSPSARFGTRTHTVAFSVSFSS
jgi:23S rRNA-/tRNA-specific pseudouridylate synthase